MRNILESLPDGVPVPVEEVLKLLKQENPYEYEYSKRVKSPKIIIIKLNRSE